MASVASEMRRELNARASDGTTIATVKPTVSSSALRLQEEGFTYAYT